MSVSVIACISFPFEIEHIWMAKGMASLALLPQEPT